MYICWLVQNIDIKPISVYSLFKYVIELDYLPVISGTLCKHVAVLIGRWHLFSVNCVHSPIVFLKIRAKIAVFCTSLVLNSQCAELEEEPPIPMAGGGGLFPVV